MTAFLDKIFGSKIEVDMAKAGLEAELSFLEARMDTHLAKRVLEGGNSPDILTKYTAFLKEMLALDMHTVISSERNLICLLPISTYIRAVKSRIYLSDLILRLIAPKWCLLW